MKYILEHGFSVDFEEIEPILDFKEPLGDKDIYHLFKGIPADHMSSLRDLYGLDFELFNYSKNVPGAEWWQVL